MIAYYRVSTKRQGKSGLGLDAQRAAVRAYADGQGAKIKREYKEVESGRKSDRPELSKALAYSKRAGCVLVVAKLDRLSRNVAFLSRLMESGVDFVACDNPHANRFTVHILAAVAEWEREQISKRTKAALAATKARGTKLGSNRPGHWDGREDRRQAGLIKGRKLARKSIIESANNAYSDIVPDILKMRENGISFNRIAELLNADGQRTRNGKKFYAATVRNICKRAKAPARGTNNAYSDIVPDILKMRNAGETLQNIADALNVDGQRTRNGKEFHPTTVGRIIKRHMGIDS